MKKFFMFALAAVAMLSVSSCMNEKEMDLAPNQGKIENEGYGYISLNATTDDAVVTRADITGASLNTWYARVYTASTTGSTTSYTYKWGEAGYELINNTALAEVGLDATKTWTVSVRSHVDMPTANAANPPYGVAYYEGTNDNVQVTAGTNVPVTVECGAPQNAMLQVTKTGFTGSNLKVYITSPRTITFTGDSFQNEGKSYYAAGEVKLYINYDFGGATDKRWPTDGTYNVTLPARTKKVVNFTMNTNGTITLTITTSDFEDGGSTAITFDAMTGTAPNPSTN